MPRRVFQFVPVALLAACLVSGCGEDVDDQTGTALDGVLPFPENLPPNLDLNCNSSNASSGAQCTQDCIVNCGFESLGTKVCPCVSGLYSQCPCLKPPTYEGAETAPLCQGPLGRAVPMDGTPCTQKWEQCIGTDTVSGTTPRGCVCLGDEGTGQLEWSCGSTNRWFRLEGT